MRRAGALPLAWTHFEAAGMLMGPLLMSDLHRWRGHGRMAASLRFECAQAIIALDVGLGSGADQACGVLYRAPDSFCIHKNRCRARFSTWSLARLALCQCLSPGKPEQPCRMC